MNLRERLIHVWEEEWPRLVTFALTCAVAYAWGFSSGREDIHPERIHKLGEICDLGECFQCWPVEPPKR